MEEKEILEQIQIIDQELISLLKKRIELSSICSTDEQIWLKGMLEQVEEPKTKELIQQVFGLFATKSKEKKKLLVSRESRTEPTVIEVDGETLGAHPQIIAGPCAVESEEQVMEVAKILKEQGIKWMRGGAYKPRTSPYDFQGLGLEGLKILRSAKERYGLRVISEVVHPGDLELAQEYLDVIQIGARNMQNFALLKELGKVNKPILLKRGLSATIEEYIYAAEYIMLAGNEQIILCERGIRTYEKATRNTLDISAVPILKQETHLPVLVDITHSTGRKDLLLPMAKAAFAAGADGIMLEVHPNPANALSDAKQQINLQEFCTFHQQLLRAELPLPIK